MQTRISHLISDTRNIKRIALTCFVLGALIMNPRVGGWNEASRMAMIQSVVEYGTLSIDQSVFQETSDKIQFEGQFYSDKAPMPAVLATPVYFAAHQLGLNLDLGWNGAYALILLLTMKAFWVGGIMAFFHLTKLWGHSEARAWLYTLIMAFVGLTFTWTVTFNGHSMSASALIMAAYFYFRAEKNPSTTNYFVLGLLLALATVFDLPVGLFMLGFSVLVLRRKTARLGAYVGGLALPLIAHSAINFKMIGSILPVQFHPEVFNYAGSRWTTGVQVNDLWFAFSYGLGSVFGPQGILWYNPLAILLLFMVIQISRSSSTLQREARMILVCSVGLLVAYLFLTQNYSGWSYGIRYLIPLLPMIYLFLPAYMADTRSRTTDILLKVTLGWTLVVTFIGTINPWSNLTVHPVPILGNLIQLYQFIF